MKYLLLGYIWLFIHRPFEVWPWLADLQIERVYMIVMALCWLFLYEKQFHPNCLHMSSIGLLAVIVLAWIGSPYAEIGWVKVETYIKIFVFYVILASSVRSQRDFKFLIVGFLVVTSVYLLHSLWEYRNGRHVYRMGTARMIGVDAYLGDPNSFAASIVYSLPFALCLLPIIKERRPRLLLYGYLVLAGSCIFLTGSRTAFVGLVFLFSLVLFGANHRLRNIVFVAIVALVAWSLLPSDRQERFLSILDPERGPVNAQASADSRWIYFQTAVQLWQESPVVGFGPGSFAIESGSGQPAHTLYGEVLAELGTAGVVAFLAVLVAFTANFHRVSSIYRGVRWQDRDFLFWVTVAAQLGILMHLVLGLGGHNTYRHTWLWFSAFQVLATHFAIHGMADHDGVRQTESGEFERLALSSNVSI